MEEDETESMITLLRRIKVDYPEADAVCSGAILSTYQRTRIESVALRMQLMPLAYLWHYPDLPTPEPRKGGLLEDMAAVGLDARIIKVASGGLVEDMLWENACAEGTRKKLAKVMKRFGGSVLGEGGEFETFVVDGPWPVLKGAIEVHKDWRTIHQAGGGEAWIGFTGGQVRKKPPEQIKDDNWRQQLRMPDLLDTPFRELLKTLDNLTFDRQATGPGSSLIRRSSTHYEWEDRWHICAGKWTTRISNISVSDLGSSTEAQMERIMRILLSVLERVLHRSAHDIVFTTILLRSMDDFQIVNHRYAELFSVNPNPPARVTVACGESLPLGVNVMISVIVSTQDEHRQRLHVQSRSYWAPANIGPYSQATKVPLDSQGSGAIVYIAGQIPLVPATMEIADRASLDEAREPAPDLADFKLQATLALQHLWRVGNAMNVGWWTSAIAFLVAGEDEIGNKASLTSSAWKAIHTQRKQVGEGNPPTESDDATFDVWNQHHRELQILDAEAEDRGIPDFSMLSVMKPSSTEGKNLSSPVPPLFVVQVAQLPRGSQIEWQALGVSRAPVGFYETVSNHGVSMTTCSVATDELIQRFVAIKLTDAKAEMIEQIEETLLGLDETYGISKTIGGHKTIYTPYQIDCTKLRAQLIPSLKMPTELEGPELKVHSVSDDEHASPKGSRRLSRPPHPYHIRNPESTVGKEERGKGCKLDSTLSMRAANDARLSDSADKNTFFDVDSRKRRKISSSPSESGTEADDEGGPFLRGLPAPPARLRKGLKDETTLGTPSPLLTPSYLDDEKKRQTLEVQFKRRASLQSCASADEETLRIREKFQRRRRAELLRRTTETVLLLGIGGLACRKALLLPISRGAFDHLPDLRRVKGLQSPAELATFALVVYATYLLYPFRLYYHHRMLPEQGNRPRQFLRIPAAFDPATLLYPVLLPVFTSASLQPQNNVCVIVNLVLGIAAMPRTIVPAQDSFSGHTSVQYLLSLLPTLFMGNGAVRFNSLPARTAADPEIVSLLYPLHQALLPSLGYLTTTSLLPAELQLLSISIINVLLLSSSPQIQILKAIVWIGGLLIFVFCRRILEWEVALARIPRWKFRKDNVYSRLHLVLKRIMKELVGGQPSHSTRAEEATEGSGSDEPLTYVRRNPSKRSRGLSFATSNGESPPSRIQTAMVPFSKVSLPVEIVGTSKPGSSYTRHQRSSTLPSFSGSLPETFRYHDDAESSSAILRLSMPRGFGSLTKEQATIVKWLFALYVYVAVIAIIALPIRMYVGGYALQGQEPIGWALGYLFGDLDWFRYSITAVGLDRWVRLPSRNPSRTAMHGWVENVRWDKVGAANSRLLICLYCMITIGFGLAVVFRLSRFADVDTRRKVFHGMMVVMFLPTIFVDPAFVALALILVLAIFLLLDLFRASQLPPLSRPLTHFLAPYVDGRDHRGPVIVSHMFLLIGCSIPLWLSLASVERTGASPWQGWEVPTRDLSMISGVVCVGMGDAAASLIGRRYGRRRWCWSGGKSLEGSTAFAVAVVLGLSLARLWLLYGEWHAGSGDSWLLFYAKATVAAGGASLTEAALTGGNDNVIVPVVLWLLVRGLAI
ncbi:MAG: hypothetical protein Q9184_000011 [Pyrenodesmia sp. 2 TL-2023]